MMISSDLPSAVLKPSILPPPSGEQRESPAVPDRDRDGDESASASLKSYQGSKVNITA
jgi:hypothetical protein